MKLMVVLVGALIAAVLVGIGYVIWFEANDPGHGTITEKKFRPAYTTTQCTTVGKVTSCVPVQHAECYLIGYTDGRHDGDACVPALEYDRYRIGEQYPAGAR